MNTDHNESPPRPQRREAIRSYIDHEYKPLIYLPNGKVLVRRAGF